MDINRYRHNSKAFSKSFTFSKSINRGKMTITKRTYACLVEKSFSASLPLVITSVPKEIRSCKECVDTAKGWILE